MPGKSKPDIQTPNDTSESKLDDSSHSNDEKESLEELIRKTNGLCLEEGRGVTVVSTLAGGSAGQEFRLQRAVLAALLARPGVAERPVVVVSVAGAFRGGKSFLLDFMLRYLYAQAGARGAPGEDWLGGERESLRGFSWRNGSARDTTGLVLWSQPVPVELPSGEQVVVLLMDTQGAFDEQSSLRDCSLVFALSTLLASVQIYNVSRRLDESDLQHLQLFTEYAALGGGGLQELQLLVRDWTAPYEHPFGAAGGAAYLRHKLQVREEQPRESREIRQRLASSFERVGCFLLPHPGLKAASDPHFRGELADITDEFKQSLRELVPLILAPENLRVKTMGGQPLRAGDLAVFLDAYLTEFRDRVPSPQTVLSATAKARWLSAAATARAALSTPPSPRALPRAGLRARLDAALRAALAPLAPLAERAGEEDALARLEQELDELLARQVDANDRMLELAAARAREQLERAARALLQGERLCVHPRDLAPALAAARDAARDRYLGDVDSAGDDPEHAKLMKELDERIKSLLPRLEAVNAANNVAGVAAARAALAGALAPRPCARAADLAAAHAAARAAAAAAFRRARSAPSAHPDCDDVYLTQLEQQIAEDLRNHEIVNDANNTAAVDDAQERYDQCFTFDGGCWHPGRLAAKHEEIKADVMDRFYRSREPSSREGDERMAVESGYQMFCSTMNGSIGFVQVSAAVFTESLNNAYRAGRREFYRYRVIGSRQSVEEDTYFNQLNQRIENRFNYYNEENGRRLTGVELATILMSLISAGAAGAGAEVGSARFAAAALSFASVVATAYKKYNESRDFPPPPH